MNQSSTTDKTLEKYIKQLNSPPEYKTLRTVDDKENLFPAPASPVDTEAANCLKQDYQRLCSEHEPMPTLLRSVIVANELPTLGSPLVKLLIQLVDNKSPNASEELIRAVKAMCVFTDSPTATRTRCQLIGYPIASFRHVLDCDTPTAFTATSLRRIIRAFVDGLTHSESSRDAAADAESRQPKTIASAVEEIVAPERKRPKTKRPRTGCRSRLEGKWPNWPPSRGHVYDCRTLKFRSNIPTKDEDPYPHPKNAQKVFLYPKSNPYVYKAPVACGNWGCNAHNKCHDCTREERGERLADDGGTFHRHLSYYALCFYH